MSIPQAILALSESPELSLVAKATVVLALGLAVTRLAMRSKASVRHLILGATFAALLALPLAMTIAPPAVIDVPVATHVSMPAAASGGQPSAMPPGVFSAESWAWEWPSWTGIARLLWGGGAMVQLLFLGSHLLRLRRRRRAAIPWIEGRKLTQSLAVERGVQREVEVLFDEGLGAPVTCGVFRPAILLPVEASAWSEKDLRRALIHELEHVRRGDWGTQLAARIAAACYWFHPLVWVAWRRLCLEAERACDDAVIHETENTEYAEQLVELARRMSKEQAQPALGMARRSDLSARVWAVLDNTRQRGRAGFLTVAAVITVSVLVLAAIAALTAVAQSTGSRDAEGKPRLQTALDRALYEAAEAGDVKEIDSLLNGGANVNAAIRGDGSPLIGAAGNGAVEAVTRLLDRGADPNMPVSGDGNPLIMAAAHGHAGVVSLLLDRGADPNMPVSGDGNPLIMGAAHGHAGVVSLLLDRGARIDEVVPGDENALIQASGNGRLDVVKLLVSRGANVNARVWVENIQSNGEWRSPLSMARKGGHQRVVEFLIASGARE